MIILLMFACQSTAREGTIVGNPGDAKTKLAGSGGIEFTSATGVVQNVLLESQGDIIEIELEAMNAELDDFEDVEINLLEPQTNLLMPTGNWDLMSIEFEYITIDGVETEMALPFSILLENMVVYLDGQSSFVISEQEYVLELARPDWLDPVLIQEAASEDVFIEAGSDEYIEIFIAVEEQTGLYVDSDGDGEVDSEEREQGSVAYTSQTASEMEQEAGSVDDTGDISETVSTCGCRDTSLSFLLWPILILGWFRRRD